MGVIGPQGLKKTLILQLLGLFCTATSALNSFASPLQRRAEAVAHFNQRASYGINPPGYSSSASAAPYVELNPSSTASVPQQMRMLIHGSTDGHKHAGGEPMEVDMKKGHTLQKRLGSRPPMCRDKCETCFPCEAVKMVPSPRMSSASIQHVAHLDYSNYNPEGWKCKCGARTFNP